MDVLRTSHMRLQQRCHDAEAHVERLLVENQRLRSALAEIVAMYERGEGRRKTSAMVARAALDGSDA